MQQRKEVVQKSGLLLTLRRHLSLVLMVSLIVFGLLINAMVYKEPSCSLSWDAIWVGLGWSWLMSVALALLVMAPLQCFSLHDKLHGVPSLRQ